MHGSILVVFYTRKTNQKYYTKEVKIFKILNVFLRKASKNPGKYNNKLQQENTKNNEK